MLNGIDISAWQRGIDTAAVPSDFVIIKATQGLDYVNDDCDRAYQQAKAAGKKLGVYHFADGNSSGTAEADYFVDNIAGYIGEAVLVLDWETDAVNCGPGYAKAFLDRVLARTGIKPMIYMSGSVVNEWDWSAVVAGDYGLWVAYYSKDSCDGYWPDAPMYPISDWSGAAMLQYTSGGRLPGWGDRLDLNVFYGDHAAWDAYAGGGTGVAPQPQPTPSGPRTAPWGVDTIQYWMNICNYNPGAPIDNLDGPETNLGVMNGQRAYGVPVDGFFGNQTQAPAEDQILSYEKRLTELGFYHGELDSIPGPQLFQAVKDFQASRGLTVDGIVGDQTFALLFG